MLKEANHTLPRFQKEQYAFTASIRQPTGQFYPSNKAPYRMEVYQKLLFNNIKSLVSACFPILTSLVDDDYWTEIIYAFLQRHRALTPYFHKIPEEFIDFLQQEWPITLTAPPFLMELAHYEWVELALDLSNDDISSLNFSAEQAFLHTHYQISPLAWSLRYNFSVHKIGLDYIPIAKETTATHIVVYRNSDDKVEFMLLNTVTAKLLEIFSSPCEGKVALVKIATELAYAEPDKILANGLDIIKQLVDANIISIYSE